MIYIIGILFLVLCCYIVLKISKLSSDTFNIDDVLTYEQIAHKNRLGGRVLNPNTGKLKKYDENHPLWYSGPTGFKEKDNE